MKVTFNWGRFAGGGGGCSGNSLDYEEQVNDWIILICFVMSAKKGFGSDNPASTCAEVINETP